MHTHTHMSILMYTQAHTYIVPIRKIKKIHDDCGIKMLAFFLSCSKLASLMGRDVNYDRLDQYGIKDRV